MKFKSLNIGGIVALNKFLRKIENTSLIKDMLNLSEWMSDLDPPIARSLLSATAEYWQAGDCFKRLYFLEKISLNHYLLNDNCLILNSECDTEPLKKYFYRREVRKTIKSKLNSVEYFKESNPCLAKSFLESIHEYCDKTGFNLGKKLESKLRDNDYLLNP